jgi:hypothetical protein
MDEYKDIPLKEFRLVGFASVWSYIVHKIKHSWKYIQISKEQRARQVCGVRICEKCGERQISKLFYPPMHAWATTGIVTQERLDEALLGAK